MSQFANKHNEASAANFIHVTFPCFCEIIKSRPTNQNDHQNEITPNHQLSSIDDLPDNLEPFPFPSRPPICCVLPSILVARFSNDFLMIIVVALSSNESVKQAKVVILEKNDNLPANRLRTKLFVARKHYVCWHFWAPFKVKRAFPGGQQTRTRF